MSDCGVCLYSEALDYDCQIEDTYIVTITESRRCCECHAIFQSGEQMEEATWHEEWDEDEDGEVEPRESIFTCLICAEIATAFYCGGDGRIYGGEFWERMSDSCVYKEMTAGCFDRLTTPEAKAELQRRWMKWKGMA